VVKHVIVERPLPDRVEEFVACALELRHVMAARGWEHYTAWRATIGDEGEPTMFNVGILGRAVPFDPELVVLECTFDDRAAFESQLEAMRNDSEVVKIILRAFDMVDTSVSRAYVLEDWWP
jgi:hypothetical protein